MKKIKSIVLSLFAITLLSSFCSCKIIFGSKGPTPDTPEVPEEPEDEILAPFTDGLTINGNLLDFTKEVKVEGAAVTGTKENNLVYSWDGGTGFYFTEETNPHPGYERFAGFYAEGRNNTLSSFIIGQYEVTQELYETVMETNPSECVTSTAIYSDMLEGEQEKYRPVDSVFWYDACIFCNKLTKLIFGEDTTEIVYYEDKEFTVPFEGPNDGTKTCYMDKSKKGYRLPTATEWEFAARGGKPAIKAGTFNDFYSGKNVSATGLTDSFSTSNIVNTEGDEIGWYAFNVNTGTTTGDITPEGKGWGTHQVGQKKQNELNLYDMSGNVYEWCYDWYYDRLTELTATNPSGPEDPIDDTHDYKTIKGGSWNMGYTPSLCITRTLYVKPYEFESGAKAGKAIGFRIVRTAE